jgi:hypothetical protein
VSNGRKLRGQSGAPAPAGSSLPYDRAEDLARQLVAAAAADDDGARLGELAGTATLDWRLAGTVIGVLASALAALPRAAAERDG